MRRMLLVSFFLLILGCVGVYLFFSVKQKPLTDKEKQTAMEKLLGHTPILSINPHQKDWVLHTGKYFSFSYPATAITFTMPSINPPDKNTLELFQFQQESPKYFFSTQVLQTKNISVYNDIPGVAFRRNNKDLYIETTMQYGNTTFPVFIKSQQDDREKTAFILSSGREYTFSIT